MNNYKELKKCRISNEADLEEIIHLGEHYLSGVFPSSINEKISKGPLSLVRSRSSGLVQLGQTYNLNQMYGKNYGYRSGLNKSMVEHLKDKYKLLSTLVTLEKGDLVVDIGSNDGTFLNFFSRKNLNLVGIDPSAEKFNCFYNDDIKLYTEFFPSKSFAKENGNSKAKLVTSISMFYDLESPLDFVGEIAKILDENGIWHFEQSYLPTMLEKNSYDTICHEHLEYYSLQVIKNILAENNMKIFDVDFNDTNGGSFSVDAILSTNKSFLIKEDKINAIIEKELMLGLNSSRPYAAFSNRIKKHRDDLRNLLINLKSDGKIILGYGASTKGNILLQYCGIDSELISHIAEVNTDKFGCFTPGTNIPIISELEAKKMCPDYFLVLPWHFKDNILRREKDYLNSGGKFIFPLPNINII